MNNGEFAQIAAYIAKKAAAWSADTLFIKDAICEPVDAAVVERFADEISTSLKHMLADVRRNSGYREEPE